MAQIEKEATEKNGLRNDVVTLYQGGQYHLYTYKKYTDVRLVFAPEFDIAFFGGDPDNFEYPRYDLDVCFFRAYEDDKPAKIEHYLKWSAGGSKDGDLVFVAGHPGRTDRLNTVASLEYLRDHRAAVPARHPRRATEAVSAGIRPPQSPKRSASPRKTSSACRTAARRGSAGSRDCATESFMKRQGRGRGRAALQGPGIVVQSTPPTAPAPGTRSPQAQKVAAKIIKPYFYLERGFAFDSDALHDRPRPGAAGRGEDQAQFRAAGGVSRIRASSRSS